MLFKKGHPIGFSTKVFFFVCLFPITHIIDMLQEGNIGSAPLLDGTNRFLKAQMLIFHWSIVDKFCTPRLGTT